jgi:hypothetical protein
MSSRPSFDPERVARVHFQPVVDTAFAPSVVHCMAAGTITIEDLEGTALQYDVLQGQTLPILCKKVTAVGGDLLISKVRCWR